MLKPAILVLVLSAILLNLCNSATFAGEVDEDLHNKCLYPTVMIFDRKTSGTAVIVRSELIKDNSYQNIAISCSHVTNHIRDGVIIAQAEYKDWSVALPDKSNFYTGIVSYKNDEIDMSIISFVSHKKMPTATISFEQNFYIGNEIIGVGCGGKEMPRVDFGKITAIYDDSLRGSIETIYGDSGGPVYHEYKLIGIKRGVATASLPSAPIFVPVTHISRYVPITLLKKWQEKEKSLSCVYDSKERLSKYDYYLSQIINLQDED